MKENDMSVEYADKLIDKDQYKEWSMSNIEKKILWHGAYHGYKSASLEKCKEISELRLLKDHIENDYNVLYKASLLQNQHQIDQGLLIHELKEKLKIAEQYLNLLAVNDYSYGERYQQIAREALSHLKNKS